MGSVKPSGPDRNSGVTGASRARNDSGYWTDERMKNAGTNMPGLTKKGSKPKPGSVPPAKPSTPKRIQPMATSAGSKAGSVPPAKAGSGPGSVPPSKPGSGPGSVPPSTPKRIQPMATGGRRRTRVQPTRRGR